MLSILLAALLATGAQAAACPDKLTASTLNAFNKEFAGLIAAQSPKAAEKAEQAEIQLACTREPPAEYAARTFLLIGAYHFSMGDPAQVERYFKAAHALVGASGWDPSLGAELGKWYKEVGKKVDDKGVVYAPPVLFPEGVHLVGTPGPSPWTITVGTFTFEASSRSVPVSVNRNTLTVVTPGYIDDFLRPVEGTTADVLNQAASYSVTSSFGSRKGATDGTQPAAGTPTPSPTGTGDAAAAPPDDGRFWESGKEPQDEKVTVTLKPHVDLGLTSTLATAGGTETLSPGGFLIFGGQVAAGASVRIGKTLSVTPKVGFRWGAGGSDVPGVASMDGQSPVAPSTNTLWAAQGTVILAIKKKSLQIGLGPAVAFEGARITSVPEGRATAVPMQGSLLTPGATVLVALRPRFSRLHPQLEAHVLTDGDRFYVTPALSVSWEGKQL